MDRDEVEHIGSILRRSWYSDQKILEEADSLRRVAAALERLASRLAAIEQRDAELEASFEQKQRNFLKLYQEFIKQNPAGTGRKGNNK